MAYQTLVTAIRDAANAVNENGTFIHGRNADGSIEYDKPYPQIHLYPFNTEVSIENSFATTSSIVMGFWQQDAPDSTNEKREEIIAEMETLCKEFLVELDESDTIRITGITMQPQYQTLSATLSGYAVQFKISAAESKC